METIPNDLSFVEDGESYATLCVDLTVYWRGSAFERADGIVQFYQRALKYVGPTLRFYETGTMSGAKAIKKDSLDMVPFWFQKAKRREDFYIIGLESGAHANEPSDRGFYLIADEEDEEPVGAMKASFPVACAAHPDRYLALVRELVEGLSFESGHAGYSLNWDARGDMAPEAELKMHYVAQRYPGVDLFSLDTTLISMRKTAGGGIKCANWLTLLGPAMVDRVGAPAEIAQRLGADCSVEPLPAGGALIRAGAAPLLGDRNRNVDMSAYRSVGRLLAPYRFVDHRQIFGSPNPADDDPTGVWLARFDR